MKYGSEVPIGDGPCTDCGQDNPFVWWTDNVFWNAVCRQPDAGPEPILCPTCFVKRVFAAGFLPHAFRLIPDWEWTTAKPSAGESEG